MSDNLRILAQYSTRMAAGDYDAVYDVFAPARFVSGLVSVDRRVGFVIFNVFLVAFGLWCFVGPIRGARPSASGIGG
jgi:hypothetical protein